MGQSGDVVHSFGHSGGTNLHPLVLILLFFSCIIIFYLQGKHVLIPFFLLTFTIPLGQAIEIGGINFLIFRIILIIMWIKILFVDKTNPIVLNRIDKAIIYWVASSVICYTILWSAFGALVNRLGFAFDGLGIYFLFRCLLKDFNDYDLIIYTEIFIAIVVAIF
ncbi:MAG TPA: hypothetical protein VHO70_01685, partial [Chitinispirillaceae bacterium]|nr:hypothetical protein [Chitinispirillaceae bacterium]